MISIDNYIVSYLHGGGYLVLANQVKADLLLQPSIAQNVARTPDVVKTTRALLHELTRKDVLFGKALSYYDCTSVRLLISTEAHHHFPDISGSVVQMHGFEGGRTRDFTIFVSPIGQKFFYDGWQSYVDDHGIMFRNKPQILVAQDHWDRFTIYCFYSSSPLPELFYTNNLPPPPPPPTPPSYIPNPNPAFFRETPTARGGEGSENSGGPQGHHVSSAGQSSRPLKRAKNKYLGSELCMVFPKLVPSTNFSNLCLASLQIENQEFGLKLMNCPGYCLMFDCRVRSYRELPLRLPDFGVLQRNEASDALTGLTRVRRFQQDDAHIFCREYQVKDEVRGVLDFIKYACDVFGLTFELQLSTRPEKYLGDVETWGKAEAALKEALDEFGSGRPWKDGSLDELVPKELPSAVEVACLDI